MTEKLEDAELMWERNAEAWTQLARMGYDVCRDGVNSPQFLKLLPPVFSLSGLDVGCGEGENTRHIASLGATMVGIDVSPTFIKHAMAHEESKRLAIEFLEARATNLPFPPSSFDFVVATMSLQDIEELRQSLQEIHRVLKGGGFFQFSICHPCFQTPAMSWIEDEHGKRKAVVSGRYFEEGRIDDEWIFSAVPEEIQSRFKPFRVAHFHRTLTTWVTMLIETGFRLDAINEPVPDREALSKYPELYYFLDVPLFLHIRASKVLI